MPSARTAYLLFAAIAFFAVSVDVFEFGPHLLYEAVVGAALASWLFAATIARNGPPRGRSHR